MNFDELVQYIKGEGCRIRIYNSRMFVTEAVGSFEPKAAGPMILLATKGHSKIKYTHILLHEYGHFLQWRCGFWQRMWGICETEDIWYDWVNHKLELTQIEHKAARNTMLVSEWDAEMRGYEQGQQLKIKSFHPEIYLKSALGYMASIKYSWANREDWNVSIQATHINKPRILTPAELFAPLTEGEITLTQFIR